MSFESVMQYIVTVFFPTLGDRLWTIVVAPSHYPGMVWILFPMVVTLLLMTFYFGRYNREELGWNTAVGNALVLLFVSIDLLQQVYPEENPLGALMLFFSSIFSGGEAELLFPGLIAGGILIYSLILLTADFFHWLPKKLAFFISSGLPLNVLAYFGIIFVYSSTAGDSLLPFDWYTLLAFFVLFVILYVLLRLLQLIEPSKEEPIDDAPAPKTPSEPAVDQPTEGDPKLDELDIDQDDPVVTGKF